MGRVCWWLIVNLDSCFSGKKNIIFLKFFEKIEIFKFYGKINFFFEKIQNFPKIFQKNK